MHLYTPNRVENVHPYVWWKKIYIYFLPIDQDECESGEERESMNCHVEQLFSIQVGVDYII